MPVTNDEIYAYLVDLSANIAQQFAQVNGELALLLVENNGAFTEVNSKLDVLDIKETAVGDYLIDLSSNLTADFAQVNIKLDVINDELITDFTEVNNKLDILDIKETAVGDYLIDLSANLTAQNEVTDSLIIDSVIVELEVLKQGLTDGFEKQTNDINTNTNTALSQYTNTINTNTNASVSSAVSILNHN